MKCGYVWQAQDGRLFVQRCPMCERENWAPAVASGQCAWCGKVATEVYPPEEKSEQGKEKS